MYTIVETGGKQYKMAAGDVLDIELLQVENGTVVTLDKVLFFSGNGEVKIGQPYLEGAKVQVAVLDKFKDKKVVVFKYKNKTGYRRLRGHRQNLNRIKVECLNIPGVGEIKAEVAASKPKKEKKTKETKE